MNNIISVFLSIIVMLCLIGCGVKSAETNKGNSNQVSTGGDLPKNVYHTAQKKFLVFASQTGFKVGVAQVFYRIVMPNLEVPRSNDIELQIKYFMPNMPEMPVTPALVKVVAPGQIEVTYDISMEGPWEFRVEIYSKSNSGLALADQFVHTDTVKE